MNSADGVFRSASVVAQGCSEAASASAGKGQMSWGRSCFIAAADSSKAEEMVRCRTNRKTQVFQCGESRECVICAAPPRLLELYRFFDGTACEPTQELPITITRL